MRPAVTSQVRDRKKSSKAWTETRTDRLKTGTQSVNTAVHLPRSCSILHSQIMEACHFARTNLRAPILAWLVCENIRRSRVIRVPRSMISDRIVYTPFREIQSPTEVGPLATVPHMAGVSGSPLRRRAIASIIATPVINITLKQRRNLCLWRNS